MFYNLLREMKSKSDFMQNLSETKIHNSTSEVHKHSSTIQIDAFVILTGQLIRQSNAGNNILLHQRMVYSSFYHGRVSGHGISKVWLVVITARRTH